MNPSALVLALFGNYSQWSDHQVWKRNRIRRGGWQTFALALPLSTSLFETAVRCNRAERNFFIMGGRVANEHGCFENRSRNPIPATEPLSIRGNYRGKEASLPPAPTSSLPLPFPGCLEPKCCLVRRENRLPPSLFPLPLQAIRLQPW